jgi:shikimate dehydrogenase
VLTTTPTRIFGLIGNPLTHSFSKTYFSGKFEREGIRNCFYENFPLSTIDELPVLIKSRPNLAGLNVTIPFKEQVLDFLDEIDAQAAAVGAVNTIKIRSGKLIGCNTDVYGFEQSLIRFLEGKKPAGALVLGTGGASKAVRFVLNKMGISVTLVSRKKTREAIAYTELDRQYFQRNTLIINTTPLGMMPFTGQCPPILYEEIGAEHHLYDLVYNPEISLFLQRGVQKGAAVKNGLEMLYLQAEKSWEIWNE